MNIREFSLYQKYLSSNRQYDYQNGFTPYPNALKAFRCLERERKEVKGYRPRIIFNNSNSSAYAYKYEKDGETRLHYVTRNRTYDFKITA